MISIEYILSERYETFKQNDEIINQKYERWSKHFETILQNNEIINKDNLRINKSIEENVQNNEIISQNVALLSQIDDTLTL